MLLALTIDDGCMTLPKANTLTICRLAGGLTYSRITQTQILLRRTRCLIIEHDSVQKQDNQQLAHSRQNNPDGGVVWWT